MKKILGMVWMLILCLSVGTVVAQALIAAVVMPKLKLDGKRISQIVSLAQGKDIEAKIEAKAPSIESEQPSYQEIVESRAARFRNLELREKQLRNNLVEVQTEEVKVADELHRIKRLESGFDEKMKRITDDATSEGMNALGEKIGSMKPKLAKEMLVKMLDDKRIDDVVVLLKQLDNKKSAKIIAEFKTDDEKDMLSEVLRRIREGDPVIEAVEKAQAKAEQNAGK
jgi:uncharacterized protein YihD (DUF1040 family)